MFPDSFNLGLLWIGYLKSNEFQRQFPLLFSENKKLQYYCILFFVSKYMKYKGKSETHF